MIFFPSSGDSASRQPYFGAPRVTGATFFNYLDSIWNDFKVYPNFIPNDFKAANNASIDVFSLVWSAIFYHFFRKYDLICKLACISSQQSALVIEPCFFYIRDDLFLVLFDRSYFYTNTGDKQAILCPFAKLGLLDRIGLNHTPKILSGGHHIDTIQAAIVLIAEIIFYGIKTR